MLSKEKLIRTLENSIKLEDEGVVLIATGLKKRIEESSLSDEKRRRLMEIADTIQRETEGHKQGIIELMEKVRGSEQDVF